MDKLLFNGFELFSYLMDKISFECYLYYVEDDSKSTKAKERFQKYIKRFQYQHGDSTELIKDRNKVRKDLRNLEVACERLGIELQSFQSGKHGRFLMTAWVCQLFKDILKSRTLNYYKYINTEKFDEISKEYIFEIYVDYHNALVSVGVGKDITEELMDRFEQRTGCTPFSFKFPYTELSKETLMIIAEMLTDYDDKPIGELTPLGFALFSSELEYRYRDRLRPAFFNVAVELYTQALSAYKKQNNET